MRLDCHVHERLGGVQVLQKAGLPEAQLVHLSSQVYELQCAFERMALVKEYRCLLATSLGLCCHGLQPLLNLLGALLLASTLLSQAMCLCCRHPALRPLQHLLGLVPLLPLPGLPR